MKRYNTIPLFDVISNIYTLINNVSTFGMINYARYKMTSELVRLTTTRYSTKILELGGGTGELARSIDRKLNSGKMKNKTVSLISQELSTLLRWKMKKNSFKRINFTAIDMYDDELLYEATSMHYRMDKVIASFVLRNVMDLDITLAMVNKMLRRFHTFWVLDVFRPKNKIVSKLLYGYLSFLSSIVDPFYNMKPYKHLRDSIFEFDEDEFKAQAEKYKLEVYGEMPILFGIFKLIIFTKKGNI